MSLRKHFSVYLFNFRSEKNSDKKNENRIINFLSSKEVSKSHLHYSIDLCQVFYCTTTQVWPKKKRFIHNIFLFHISSRKNAICIYEEHKVFKNQVAVVNWGCAELWAPAEPQLRPELVGKELDNRNSDNDWRRGCQRTLSRSDITGRRFDPRSSFFSKELRQPCIKFINQFLRRLFLFPSN